MEIKDKKILLTGGATGIGFAMAERLANDGNTVIICGRRLEALEAAVAKIPSLIIRRCDLASADERESLFEWIAEAHQDVNVLINNAGIQNWMSVTDTDFFTKAKQEIAVNIEAPLHLTQLFLGLSHLNTIINVTSGLSFVPFTKVPVYSATKAFFHSITLSLQHLLKSKNIAVIEVVPPALNTDLGGKGLHDHAPAVSGFIDSIFEQLKDGKITLTYGFSEQMSKAGQEVFQPVFKQLNPEA
jgi:uncharacterized oxidoreductase